MKLRFILLQVCEKGEEEKLRLEYSVKLDDAKENDVVLLSPACTSFDEFNSYKERGEMFEKIVKEYDYAQN